MNNRLDLKDTAAELEVGCPHFAGIFALGGALDLIAEIGAERIERRVHELVDYLHARVTDARLKIVSPANRNQRSGITVIETIEAQRVVQALAEKKIIVSARGKGIRVSAHIFNNFEDFDRLLPALVEIL